MNHQKAKTSDFNGFAKLIEVVWCPICGSKLSIKKQDSKSLLMCPEHGEMKFLWMIRSLPLLCVLPQRLPEEMLDFGSARKAQA